MGCHSWIYKKVTSFPKEELNKRLQEVYDKEMNCWIGKTPREQYAKELFEDLPHTVETYRDKAMKDYLIEKMGTYEKCLKIWDDWHKEIEKTKERIDKFCSSEEYDPKEYYEIIKGQKGYSCDVRIYKDDYYIHYAGNNIFRCHKYSEDDGPFDNENDLIKFLEQLNETSIIRWNENDDQEYGLTDKLREIIKELFKNDDVFVEFG